MPLRALVVFLHERKKRSADSDYRFNALTGFGCISTGNRNPGGTLGGCFNALTGFGCISTLERITMNKIYELSFNALTGFGCISTVV